MLTYISSATKLRLLVLSLCFSYSFIFNQTKKGVTLLIVLENQVSYN